MVEEDVMRLAGQLSIALSLQNCIAMCRIVSPSSEFISKEDFISAFGLSGKERAMLPAECGDEEEVKVWMCTICDFLNPGSEDYCLACQFDCWGGVKREAKPASDQWECDACKYFNSIDRYFCE